MSGVLYGDDAAIVDLHVRKDWAGEDGPGVMIYVREYQP